MNALPLDTLAFSDEDMQSKCASPTGLDVRTIHPDKHPRYSPNLYKWLTARGKEYRSTHSRIYRDHDGMLYIGMMDDGFLIGSRLGKVLCEGAKAESWCYGQTRLMVEVTDFWQRYVRDGRCAIDTEHNTHFVGDGSRWAIDGDRRTCLWCGNAEQVLTRWTETVQRELWINSPPAEESAKHMGEAQAGAA